MTTHAMAALLLSSDEGEEVSDLNSPAEDEQVRPSFAPSPLRSCLVE